VSEQYIDSIMHGATIKTADNVRYELTYPNLQAEKRLAVFAKNKQLRVNFVRTLKFAALQMY